MMEILKITVPALLVLAATYMILTRMLKRDEMRLRGEIAKADKAVTLPVRLGAYERLALLLERTMPNALLVSIIKPQMTCLELQSALLETIRKEFQHNAVQQIYVSSQLWQAIRASGESLAGMVNSCAARLKPADDAALLAEMIIKLFSSARTTPSEMAMEMLKNEARGLF